MGERMSVMDDWLHRGKRYRVAGRSLLPDRHPLVDVALQAVRSQAESYWLTDDEGHRWILKRFLPGATPDFGYVGAIGDAIPLNDGFTAAYQRVVIRDPSSGDPNMPPGLAAWLDHSILMPMVRGATWGTYLQDLSEGSTSRIEDRLSLAYGLASQLAALEAASISHRDLSDGNIILEGTALSVSLIDWDSASFPGASYQPKTTVGTPGYIAPWASRDPRESWRPYADRFALAVCIGELLATAAGDTLRGNGSWFDQAELHTLGERANTLVTRLSRVDARLAQLLERSLGATSFDTVPDPWDWVHAIAACLHGDVRPVMRLRTSMLAAQSARRALLNPADSRVSLADKGWTGWLSRAETTRVAELLDDQVVAQGIRRGLAEGSDHTVAMATNGRPPATVLALSNGERLLATAALGRIATSAQLTVQLGLGDEIQTLAVWDAMWRHGGSPEATSLPAVRAARLASTRTAASAQSSASDVESTQVVPSKQLSVAARLANRGIEATAEPMPAVEIGAVGASTADVYRPSE